MSRHTTFRFCLDPTVEQREVLARHAGAARFAFNQCLRIVKAALTQRRADSDTDVPWTGFDLINAFNGWKTTQDAGRVFTVGNDGVTEAVVTGLPWRAQVRQQVFEEAAVDLGKGLKAWSDSRSGKRQGKRVGFPKFKKKTAATPSFRLRNKHPKGRPAAIRVGDNSQPRSITVPGIGQIAVHDDTRRLRRMIRTGRATICFATITYRGGRWWVALNIEAADLHPAHQHPARDPADHSGWVGIDRGLSVFLVAATTDGTEVARITDAPKATGPQPESATAAREIVVAQEERITQPPRRGGHARTSSPSRRQHPAAFPAPGFGRAGQDPRPARDRGPECVGDAGQPSPGPRHLRCRVGRVRQTAQLQTGLARRRTRCR